MTDAYRILRSNSAIYIFCHWSKWADLSKNVEQVGFKIKNMIVMNKSNHGMGDLKGSYAPKHELLMYAVKGRHTLIGRRIPDIWDVPIQPSLKDKRPHPNTKMISWMEPAILHSSEPGQTVLDPFAGVGSTPLAAYKNNRGFIGIEISPEYHALGLKRLTEEGCVSIKNSI